MYQNLFAIPIYYELGVKNFKNIQKEIKGVVSKETFDLKQSTHYLSDFTKNIVEELPLFKEELDRHVKEYCKGMGLIPKYEITTSWFSKFEKGNYAHVHNHGSADISGIYYYKAYVGDGDLFFEHPIIATSNDLLFRNQPQWWTHEPTVGKIMLFPSWLRHGVQTNTSGNTRISLSFNINFTDVKPVDNRPI